MDRIFPVSMTADPGEEMVTQESKKPLPSMGSGC